MSNNISNLHLDILDRDRQELLQKLLPFTREFILGGGTALALQLNHRKSYDFDFFNSSSINKKLLEKLSTSLSIANISVDTADELTFFTNNELKVTFLHYPFPHVYPLKKAKNGLELFSTRDIALQKAHTIGRRGEYRDYFDLYTILKNNFINLSEIISQTKKIFGGAFEEKLFLQQLVYFDDLLNFDIIPPSPEQKIPTRDEVKQFFETLVGEYIS